MSTTSTTNAAGGSGSGSVLLVNGKIFQASAAADDSSQQPPQFQPCMLVQNGTITHVGAASDAPIVAAQQAEPSLATRDLGGRTVIPGCIDGHLHTLTMGQTQTKVALDGCKSLDDIRARVARHARENPDAKRIMASGWMFSMTPDGVHHGLLDDIDPRPIYVDSKDLHHAWLNAAAIADLGCEGMPDPEGGRIFRDDKGTCTGELAEAAVFTIVWPHLAAVASFEERVAAISGAVDAYHAAGYTGMIDMAMDAMAWEAILEVRRRRIEKHGSFGMRVAAYWLIIPAKTEAEHLAQVDVAIAMAAKYGKETTPDCRVVGIKVVCDGIVDACTASLREPYTSNAADPASIWSREQLDPVVAKADAANLQVALHAIGDRTVEMLIGPHRCGRAFAYSEFAAAGAPLALGSDAPTAPNHPLQNLYVATTRRSAREPELQDTCNPHFRLGLCQAVSAAGAGAAYSCFMDGETGRLDVGMKADFAVVDMEWAPEQLLGAKILETWFDGRKVFEA
ncbi:amidohydrolase family protein [Pyricularia oryzae Y34]|uniref:Amidohydrolase family protein n=1 Tax=Pyricularia oryzae (strain Y34) TaxID=1143189 RepID=A0AA97PPS2_PYRO3|nr:amidohydrolase family protein [Pyricularia oryzae Y34]